MRLVWMILAGVGLWYVMRGTVRRFLSRDERPRVDHRPDDRDRHGEGTTTRTTGFTEQDDVRDAKYREL